MTAEQLQQAVQQKFGDKVTYNELGKGCPLFEITPDDLLEICKTLRDDDELKFDCLCNLGGIDTGERLEVIYNLVSYTHKHRLDIKVILGYDSPAVETVSEIWPAANWHEREMWELYGIDIKNHPNLTLLLLPEDWDQGAPMRKDWDAPDFIRMPEL
jgi:NADH-quinone oxidoreductase subunit C